MSEVAPGPGGDDRDARTVADAFAAFRDINREAFSAPPVEWVFATARRRQRVERYRGWLATAAAVLPAILLALGSTTLLNFAGGDEPRRAESTDDVAEAPSTSPSYAPTSPTPQPGTGTRSRQPTKPHGGTWFDLANATVDLPPVAGCSGGLLTLSAGWASDAGGCAWQVGIWRSHYANLDGVPGQEIVTRFTAGGTPGVVALRPAGRNATVWTMGYVMTAADTGGLSVDWIGVSLDGLVTVGLSDGSGGTAQQTRSYRWEPSAQTFVLVGEPAKPPGPEPEPEPVPTDPTIEPSTTAPSDLPSHVP
jgi:hypothetical protein